MASGGEEPQGEVSVELQRRYLRDAEFRARVEMTRKLLLADGVKINRAIVLVIVDAAERAREDTERPDEDEYAEQDRVEAEGQAREERDAL
jgi:ketosteroid isomerase-like protein